MIVVTTFLELINRSAFVEIVTHENAGVFELREHAVNRGEPDIAVFIQEKLVDFFGRKMALAGFLRLRKLLK